VHVIPNDNLDWDSWNHVGMAIWAATDGSAEGFKVFDKWSQKSRKYNARATSKKWSGYVKSPPTRIGFGTLKHLADQADPTWQEALRGEPPKSDPDDPGPQPPPIDDPEPQSAPQGGAGQARPVFDPWQPYIVPPFPLDVLPPVAQEFVVFESEVV